MNEQLLRKYIRENLQNRKHANEGYSELTGKTSGTMNLSEGMVIGWLLGKTMSWMTTDDMNDVVDAIDDLGNAAEDLQDTAQEVIEELPDAQIRRLILQQGQAIVPTLQAAIDAGQQQVVAALQGAVKSIGAEEAGEGADEDDVAAAAEDVLGDEDITAMASLAMGAAIAKVIIDFAAR